MGLATVIRDIAPIYERPDAASVRIDEVLYGMSVALVEESDSGWCYVRTEFKTEGYTPSAYLERRADVAGAWRKYPKMTVLAPYIDVQKEPGAYAPLRVSVPRGGILVSLGAPAADGWVKVGLANGSVGYTRMSYIGDVINDWHLLAPDDVRWNIVETALAYNGAAYRAGGRTPFGIDSVGLAAMSYLINGVVIPREAVHRAGSVLHTIPQNRLNEGDLVYFQTGIGIYIGDDKFIHATEAPGYEGVIVNSLNPRDEEYRADMANQIVAVASIF